MLRSAGIKVFTMFAIIAATPSLAYGARIFCTPTGVVSKVNLVHVECSSAPAGIRYFAVDTTSSAEAARFTDLATAALVNNLILDIFYDDTDTLTGPTFGCDASNCRPALTINLQY